MFFLPESPKYLIDNGYIDEAKEILRMTLGTQTCIKGEDEVLENSDRKYGRRHIIT
jgi:hypothetical protein